MKNESTTITPGFTNLTDFHKRFPDEESCRAYLELIRWKGNITCPHCKGTPVYRIDGGKKYKCGSCGKKSSVKVGTIFEQSPLPLSKWFLAFHFVASRKKGISSIQLANDIGVTQKTAWFMLGRLRYALRARSFEVPLKGIVEADEAYVGGKPRKKSATPPKRGRSTEKKTPVLAVVERGGELRSMPSADVKAATITDFLEANVSPNAVLMTDEFSSYGKMGDIFAGHESVNHAQGQYVRCQLDGPKVHTNTIEGAFSHFKRMIYGTYHHISREHTHRYCAEHDYRYNTRTMKSPDRFVRTLGMVEGRLTYKILIANGTRVQRINRATEEAKRREEWTAGLLPF
ncbi:MAG: IS1595 family transposase [Candidatus Kapaibacterium sp.]